MKQWIILSILLLGLSAAYGQKRIVVHRNPERTSGAQYVEQNIPSTLSPYLWLDASDPSYFSSDLNLNTTFTCPGQ